MDYELLNQDLQELCEQLSIKVRYEKGDFDGGYCILFDQRVIVVNKKLPAQRKAAILALSVNEFGIDNVYIKPLIREFIDDEVAKARRGANV